jgi:hypothetical protein
VDYAGTLTTNGEIGGTGSLDLTGTLWVSGKAGFSGTNSFSGTLAGGGAIDFTAGSDVLSGVVISVADITVTGAMVTLSGPIVVLDPVTVSGDLLVGSGGAVLAGTGGMDLTDSADNEITGATSTSALTNDLEFRGSGQLGAGHMELINEAGAYIASVGANALVINTGASTITNAGLIESEGTGGLTIASPIDNTGKLFAYSSKLTITGPVTGAGEVEAEAGEEVDFSGTGNVFSGDLFGAGTLAITGGTAALAAGTSLDVAKVSQSDSTVTVDVTTLAYDGGWDQTSGTLSVSAGGAMNLHGTGNAFSGALTGAGSVGFAGGTDVFDAEASLTIAKVTQSAGATVTIADPTLTYAGAWDQTGGTLTVSSGDKITFTGTGNIFSGTLAGAGTIDFTGDSDTLSGTTLSVTNANVSGSTVTLTGAITLTDTLVAASP